MVPSKLFFKLGDLDFLAGRSEVFSCTPSIITINPEAAQQCVQRDSCGKSDQLQVPGYPLHVPRSDQKDKTAPVPPEITERVVVWWF